MDLCVGGGEGIMDSALSRLQLKGGLSTSKF